MGQKELNSSQRKNWVAFNMQTNFLSNAMNEAVNTVISQTNFQSTEKFKHFYQCCKFSIVPPTDKTMTNPLSEAMYTAISKDFDNQIHSLNEAVDK